MADAVRVHDTIDGFRRALDAHRAAGATVGFVPTMGYLHDGHASLMREAARRDQVATASIFVNPLQFAATEDLSTYPRDLERDLALAEAAGVTEVFHPGVEEMYPRPVLTTVTVAEITRRFEGAARPEHFAGVATVVAKLFSIVGPCRSYFGEKDFQQLAVVRRMAADLSMPVEVVGCPIVREADGLAMSSRNVYLTPEQRVPPRCCTDPCSTPSRRWPGAPGRWPP
jgi:pantoate--beta-alanine ligase